MMHGGAPGSPVGNVIDQRSGVGVVLGSWRCISYSRSPSQQPPAMKA
jgi:hypothetical protein